MAYEGWAREPGWLMFKTRIWFTRCGDCRRNANAMFGGGCTVCMYCDQKSPHLYSRRERREWKQEHRAEHAGRAAREARLQAIRRGA